MTTMHHMTETTKRIFVSILFLGYLLSMTAIAQSPAQPEQSVSRKVRDGQHDFDFNFGAWHTHIRRLVHPLTGSNEWVELDGTVHVRKVWNGRAQLEEIDARGPSGHLEGLTLFLYNSDAHQWGQYFVSKGDGAVTQPMIGEFRNGRGELFDQESFNGRTVQVRFVWSDITTDSHRVEQSFSDDGGKTWEPNFIATLTRDKGTIAAHDEPSAPTSTASDGSHDFDFNFGEWKTHIHRLLKPLTGSQTWTDYDGTSVVSRVWGGQASLFELQATGPAGHIEGVGLRLFNPQSHQWSLNWANGSDAVMTTPMIGKFLNGQGQFYDQEDFQGRVIMSRNGFYDITPTSSRFEQAFSDDAGKTWETNWVMTFTR